MLLKGTPEFNVLSELKITELVKGSWEVVLRKNEKLFEVNILVKIN
ncbi:MAG: hypothetical protein ACK52J_02560 [bacterium]